MADTQYLDLVASTLDSLGPPKWSQIAQKLQDYPVMREWLKSKRVVLADGRGIQRNLLDRVGESQGGWTTLFAEDKMVSQDHMRQLRVDWAHYNEGWPYDVKETFMNSGDSLVFDVIKPREEAVMIRIAQDMEDAAWTLRASTQTDLPNGVPYYIVPATSTTGGFNGGLPTGHTLVANVDPAVSTNYKNWNQQYNAITKADLVTAMKRGARKTNFKPPTQTGNHYTPMRDDRRMYYCNDNVLSGLETVGENQNENLGRDIDRYFNEIVFQGHPCVYVPKLDEDTKDSVYQIDHDAFIVYVLQDDNMRRSGPMRSGRSHDTFEVWINLTLNFVAINRRALAVYSKP